MNKPTKPFRKARKPMIDRELMVKHHEYDATYWVTIFASFLFGIQVTVIVYLLQA